MEKNPVESEEKNEDSDNGRETLKVWFQENVRMIVSVLIVILIAGGIYSYSKRTQAPVIKRGSEIAQEDSEGKISVIGGESNQEGKGVDAGVETEESVKSDEQPTTIQKDKTKPIAEISKETETSFQETAVKGDGSTKLARRALANYLEKNPDSSLTAEHKVYIEDYLRRRVSNGKLKVGDTREFSKDMIARAIEKSKSLTDMQLKNLKKYARKIPELK